MDRTPADWERHAARMADATVRPDSRWHRPLAMVPRHLFVPRWWTWSKRDGTWGYELHDGPSASEAWLNSAYDQRRTLTTRVGPHHADHATPGTVIPEELRPTSSSTLPLLVVEMYRHAHIADGSRVLVTCGSGYGTALACRRLGDERVTSVDVDPYLVEAARERLAAAGHRPRVEVCDVTGELPGVFDRIVSTVSVPTIPSSWLEALAPGGRLVTTVSGTGLVITADKTEDGGAIGRVAPGAAAFMSTRRGDDYPPDPERAARWETARTAEGTSVTTGRYPVMRVNSAWDVLSTFELIVPGVEHRMDEGADGTRTAYMIHPDGSWARAEATDRHASPTVHQDGPRRLWDRLEKIRTWLVVDGDLPVAGANVRIDPDGTCHLTRGGWSETIGAR
ncbi:protein-L-isoaspartate O-methyltransferase [Streptomyces sp. NPDC057638]|uniref:protein-L-isoaspartate O-methyltransferase family protein n=1 Tax=Streptomyces sp. NPDC057638 TaxID=3346190 RepID=UPI0036CF3527